MQIFDLYSAIETPILTKWIDCLHGFKFCKSMLRDSFCKARERDNEAVVWAECVKIFIIFAVLMRS